MSDVETHVAYRPSARGMAGGMVLTVLIHGALLWTVYQSQRRTPPRPEAVRDFIVTRTVTLGKKREKFWLPRIVEPPKPKPPPVIKLTENPEAPAVPPEAKEPPPKPEEKPVVRKDVNRAMDRLRRLAAATEEDPEGSPTGLRAGNSTEAVSGDEYFSQVNGAIHQNWSTPAGLLNEAQLAALNAEVRVRIEFDGSLLNPVLNKSSGNQMFDDSCLQAVRATGKVPPPPLSIRARTRRGVALMFEGKDLGK